MAAPRRTIPPSNEADPPAPLDWLPKDCHTEWVKLWRSGISSTWTVGEHDQVARLAYLRRQFQAHGDANVDTLARLHPQITKLEGALLLTPEAQVRAGVSVDEPVAVEVSEEAERRRADIRKRLATPSAN